MDRKKTVNKNKIPVTVRLFLWRQTNSFFSPKLKKLKESSITTWERVLVQNLLDDLSPVLSQSIRDVPRWNFIKTAFPFLLHCGATVLKHKKVTQPITPKMPVSSEEIKLFYIVNWMLLDAFSECVDVAEFVRNFARRDETSILDIIYAFEDIKLFALLFCPLFKTIASFDLSNIRLESGAKVWKPFGDNYLPNIYTLSILAKPCVQKFLDTLMEEYLKNTFVEHENSETLSQDPFNRDGIDSVDDVSSVSSISQGSCFQIEPPPSTTSLTKILVTAPKIVRKHQRENSKISQITKSPQSSVGKLGVPLVSMKDICDNGSSQEGSSTSDSFNSNDLSSPPDRSKVMLASSDPSKSVSNKIKSVSIGLMDSAQKYLKETAKKKLSGPTSYPKRQSSTGTYVVDLWAPEPSKDGIALSPASATTLVDESMSGKAHSTALPFNVCKSSKATIFDIGVIHCLLTYQWADDGVLWGLEYLTNRLSQIYQNLKNELGDSDYSKFRRRHLMFALRRSMSFHQGMADPRNLYLKSLIEKEEKDGTRNREPRQQLATGSNELDGKKSTDEQRLALKFPDGPNSQSFKSPRRTSLPPFDERAASLDSTQQVEGDKPIRDIKKFVGKSRKTKNLKVNQSEPKIIKDPRESSISSRHSIYIPNLLRDKAKDGLHEIDHPDGKKGPTSTLGFPLKHISRFSQGKASGSKSGYVMPTADAQAELIGSKLSNDIADDDDIIELRRSPKSGKRSDGRYDNGYEYIDDNNHLGNNDTDSIENIKYHDVDGRWRSNARSLRQGGARRRHRSQGPSHYASDSKINYQNNVYQEIPGCVNYITPSGHINLKVVLQAIFHALRKENNYDICRAASHCLSCILRKFNPYKYRSKMAQTHHNGLLPQPNLMIDLCTALCLETSQLLAFDPENVYDYGLILEITTRVTKNVGCHHGCRYDGNLAVAQEVKKNSRSALMTLYQINASKYIDYFQSVFISQPLTFQIDFYHAFFNFCVVKKKADINQKDSNSWLRQKPPKNNIEYITLECIFNNFISILNNYLKTIINTENWALYTDIVKFVNFVKTDYPTIFNMVALSGLNRSNQNIGDILKMASIIPVLTYDDAAIKESKAYYPSMDEDLDTLKHMKMSLEDLTSKDRKGLGIDYKNGRSQIRKIMDRCLIKKRSSKKAKGKTIESLIRATELQKITAFHHFAFNNTKKSGANIVATNSEFSEDMSRTSGATFKFKNYLLTDKQKAEKLSRAGLTRNQSSNEMLINGGFDQPITLVVPGEDLDRQIQILNLYVEIENIKKGLLRLHSLFQCSHIGSFPEPIIVASMLDMDAPVIARGTFLAECCHYVHLCNMGKLPNAGKHDTACLSSPINDSSFLPINKKYVKKLGLTKISLGQLFFAWGEAIASKLFMIMNNPHSEFSASKDSEYGHYYRAEDFFKKKLSPSRSPIYLLFLAAQLLLEITIYLKGLKKKKSKVKAKKYGVSWEKKRRSRWNSILGLMGMSITSLSSNLDFSEPRKSLLTSNMSPQKEDSSQSSVTSVHGDEIAEDKKSPGERTFTDAFRDSKKILKRRFGSSIGSISGQRKSSVKRTSLKMKQTEGQKGDEDHRKLSVAEHSNQSIDQKASSTRKKDKDVERKQSADNADEMGEGGTAIVPDKYPWIAAGVSLQVLLDYECSHEENCSKNCYKLVFSNCEHLIQAIGLLYQYDLKEDKRSPIHALNTVEYLKSKLMPNKPELSFDEMLKKQYLYERYKGKERMSNQAILRYLNNQVKDCSQAIIGILVKVAYLIPEKLLKLAMLCAWKLLQESNRFLIVDCAGLFILGSIRYSDYSIEIIRTGLNSKDPKEVALSLQRFYSLWRYRNYVWPQIHDDHASIYKITPPNIEFTLPSPMLGISIPEMCNPPWSVINQSSIDDITMSQDVSSAMITTAKSRKKQKEEFIEKIKMGQKEKFKTYREKYHLSSIAYRQQASFDPLLNRNFLEVEEENDDKYEIGVNYKISQTVFPSSLTSVFLKFLEFLSDDHPLYKNSNQNIKNACHYILWQCMCADPLHFLRCLLEKITKKEMPFLIDWTQMLIYHLIEIPPYLAYILFNYILGYAMQAIRSAKFPEAQCLGCMLLYQTLPFVHGITIKDLHQTFRREQCDMALSVVANNPPTKKIIVHAPDLTSIPTQLAVNEQTKFKDVLIEGLDFFNVDEQDYYNYQLINTKTGRIHNPRLYVKDFYIFKKSVYPQLSIIKISPEDAKPRIQKESLMFIANEINKIELASSFLTYSVKDGQSNAAYFLFDELKKNSLLLRKILNPCFIWHQNGMHGRALMSMDILHAYCWIKLMSEMFNQGNAILTGFEEFQMFIAAITGNIVLYSDNFAIMSNGLATLTHFPINYKHIFGNYGYIVFVPALLKVYAYNRQNSITKNMIQDIFQVFYILHRKPFILQVLACISQVLEANESLDITYHIDTSIMYDLVFSLERSISVDFDHVTELIQNSTNNPIQCLDICYTNESEYLNFMEVVTLAVTVIAYNPESSRSLQMLMILRDVVPHYLNHLINRTKKQSQDKKVVAEEMTNYKNMYVDIHALLKNVEYYTRPFVGHLVKETERKLFTNKNLFEHFRDIEKVPDMDHKRQAFTSTFRCDDKNMEQYYEIYARPRDILLAFVCDFVHQNQARINELLSSNVLDKQNFNKSTFQLDQNAHMRLAEIANVMLKLVPYDITILGHYGLECYLTRIMPSIDWSSDAFRPTLNIIYKRLDKMFLKIYKSLTVKRSFQLDYLTVPINGLVIAMKKFPFIAHLPNIKSITQVCIGIVHQNAVMNKRSINDPDSTFDIVKPSFLSSTFDLAIEHMSVLGDSFINMAPIAGVNVTQTAPNKIENILFFFYTPLLLYYTKSGYDCQIDIRVVTQILGSIVKVLDNTFRRSSVPLIFPSNKQSISPQSNVMYSNIKALHSTASDESTTLDGELLTQIAMWGLKVTIVFNENMLQMYMIKIYRILSNLVIIYKNSNFVKEFEKFILTYRPNLYLDYIFIKRMAAHKSKTSIDEFCQAQKKTIFRTKADIIQQLMEEFKAIKRELDGKAREKGKMNHLSSVVIDSVSDNSQSTSPLDAKPLHLLNEARLSKSRNSKDSNDQNDQEIDEIGCKRYGHGRKTLRLTRKRSNLKRDQAFYAGPNNAIPFHALNPNDFVIDEEERAKSKPLNPSTNNTLSTESMACSETSALLRSENETGPSVRGKKDMLFENMNVQNI